MADRSRFGRLAIEPPWQRETELELKHLCIINHRNRRQSGPKVFTANYKDIHQNHLSRCFVDAGHVRIEVHPFLFTSLFDVDVVN